MPLCPQGPKISKNAPDITEVPKPDNTKDPQAWWVPAKDPNQAKFVITMPGYLGCLCLYLKKKSGFLIRFFL